jgi:hypothetical protein
LGALSYTSARTPLEMREVVAQTLAYPLNAGDRGQPHLRMMVEKTGELRSRVARRAEDAYPGQRDTSIASLRIQYTSGPILRQGTLFIMMGSFFMDERSISPIRAQAGHRGSSEKGGMQRGNPPLLGVSGGVPLKCLFPSWVGEPACR